MNPQPAEHPFDFDFNHRPRQDAITNALNAYNLTQADERKAWAYFYDITDVAPADGPHYDPEIELEDELIADLQTPWQSMRPKQVPLLNKANYRFLCFIHRHRIFTRHSGKKAVYTISIWDREFEWMSWHDMYPHGRAERRRDIEKFWRIVDAPGCGFLDPREEFLKDKMRWHMSYHACERAEAALRDTIAPRFTLWAVMAIGLHHMSHGSTVRHINTVPDEFGVFAGSNQAFLPNMFVRLLWLCIRSPRVGEERRWNGKMDGYNGNDELKRFVEQFRIADRLTWMKADIRSVLQAFMKEGSLDWLKGVTWFFPALRIPPN